MPSRAVTVRPTARVRGRVRLPGDKSISHRYALLAALATGSSTIRGYSTGGDCASTLRCLRGLGVAIDDSRGGLEVRIEGRGLAGFVRPHETLDAGNSGSTLRMLAGILAAHPFRTAVDGDASLKRRPMRRVIVPLERMGARVESSDGRPPLVITGTETLTPIDFQPEVPSAQVKSAVLLAGLHAPGSTSVLEPIATRDHTERALTAFGATVRQSVSPAGTRIALEGRQPLTGRTLDVPGDISSAAFWMVAAAALPGSDVVIEHVGLNPTRTAIIDILRRMGASIDTEITDERASEPIGTIRVRHGAFTAAEIAPDEVPGVIDELPVLAALAAQGGELVVTGAQELRVKESDRISALAEGLRQLGADIDERADGFHVRAHRLTGGEADAKGDHRLAMAFTIAALGANGPSTILDAGAADVSYPEFFAVLDSLRA
jgi:3-phosphoshikimate 1-carboxyvinyltransferase